MENTKRIAAIMITIVVLFSMICIPVAAEPSSGVYSEIAVTGTLAASADSWSIATPLAGNQETGNALRVASDQHNTTAFTIYRSSVKKVRFVSAIENANCYIIARGMGSSGSNYYVPTSDGGTTAYTCNNPIVINDVTYYYCDCQWTYITSYAKVNNAQLPYYDNVSQDVATSEACDFLYDVVNPPITETAHQINYSIPAGYVAFFDIHGLSNIRGSVKAFSAVALTPQQWASTNVLYGYTSSIPSSFNLPLTGSTSYSWNAGKTNIFGKSQNWSWLGVYSGNSNYLFISNPTYSNVTGVMDNGQSMIVDNPSATNSYVDVFLDQAYSVKLVSLNAVITYDPQNGNYGGIDDGNGDTTYDVEYNDESQQWVTTDQNGTPVGPEGIPIGGDNSIDTPSEFGNIAAWLENIAHQISAFFTGAIGAVTTLVNAGSAFIHQLISLYSWLPAPVYAVLSSALILVITIGVIKVFI